MRRRTWIITLVLAAAAVATVPLLVYGGPGHRGFGAFAHGHLQEHLTKELDLSDQQKSEIKAIFDEMRKKNVPYHEQMHGGIASIVQTLIDNPADVATAQAILSQQTQAEDAMKANLLTAASRALSVLTPDQREKLGDLVEKHKERWHVRQRG